MPLDFSTQPLSPNANIWAMCPNKLARSYQGLHVKTSNKQAIIVADKFIGISLSIVCPHDLKSWHSILKFENFETYENFASMVYLIAFII